MSGYRTVEGWLNRQDVPNIVCLCGSTRFYEAFMQANYEETMKGNIVLSVGFFMHRPDTAHGQALGCTAEQKLKLDALHKQKIDLADEVFVLNVGGYVGSSTRSEIEHAQKTGKPIRYLEPPVAPGEQPPCRFKAQHNIGFRCPSCGVIEQPPAPPSQERASDEKISLESATTIAEEIIKKYQQLERDGYTHWHKRSIGLMVQAGVNTALAAQPSPQTKEEGK